MPLDSQICQEEPLAWARNDTNINQKSIFDYVLGYLFIGAMVAPTSYFITGAVMERHASAAEYAAITLLAVPCGIIWVYSHFLKDMAQESNQGVTQP